MKLRKPDDFHIHFRQDLPLQHYVADTAQVFARALVMPNTIPPIISPRQILSYKESITNAHPNLTPLMTFKVMEEISPEKVPELKTAGAVAGKLYPKGVTTNAEDGSEDTRKLYPIFKAMEEQELVLCIHGEKPGAFVLDRERLFLEDVTQIVSNFPRLRIVLEHVSTAAAVNAVKDMPRNVAATVTVHHLLKTLDDLIGGSLKPHLFCKPVLKSPADRKAIINAVLSGDPKFFFGSDSAPHKKEDKECAEGCAGVYTSPVAMPLLTQFFQDHQSLHLLEDFVSAFGADFYGLELNREHIELVQKPWKVPDEYHGVIPLCAGETLQWQVQGE